MLYSQCWSFPKSCQRCLIQREVRSHPDHSLILHLCAHRSLCEVYSCFLMSVLFTPYWIILQMCLIKVLMVAASSLLVVRHSSFFSVFILPATSLFKFALQCTDESFSGPVPALICVLPSHTPLPTCLRHLELPAESLLVLFQL